MKKKINKKTKKNEKKSCCGKKVVYWVPRILSILFVLFISLFAMDVFGEGLSFFQTIVALCMHLIPSAIALILICVAWKWEKIGGILFLILSIIFTIFFHTYKDIWSFLLLSIPLLIIGTLFLLSYRMNKN